MLYLIALEKRSLKKQNKNRSMSRQKFRDVCSAFNSLLILEKKNNTLITEKTPKVWKILMFVSI